LGKGKSNKFFVGCYLTIISLAWALVSVPLCGEQPADLKEGMRALYRGHADEAAKRARNHLNYSPRSTAARLLLAQAEISRGRYAEAFEELLKVTRVEPRNIDALYHLGRLCTLLMQAEYERLYAMAPDSARVHQLLAESYAVQGNTKRAEEEYQAALKADPHSVVVLNALGDLKRSQFRFDEAIAYYRQVQTIAPRDYDSAYGLGACYLFRQQPEGAIKYLRQALAIDPSSAAARLALGDALLRVDQPAKAVIELQAAVAREPDMRQAFTLLARAYRRLGRAQEAEEALKKSQELTRKAQEARVELLTTEDVFSAPPPIPAETEAREPEK